MEGGPRRGALPVPRGAAGEERCSPSGSPLAGGRDAFRLAAYSRTLGVEAKGGPYDLDVRLVPVDAEAQGDALSAGFPVSPTSGLRRHRPGDARMVVFAQGRRRPGRGRRIAARGGSRSVPGWTSWPPPWRSSTSDTSRSTLGTPPYRRSSKPTVGAGAGSRHAGERLSPRRGLEPGLQQGDGERLGASIMSCRSPARSRGPMTLTYENRSAPRPGNATSSSSTRRPTRR